MNTSLNNNIDKFIEEINNINFFDYDEELKPEITKEIKSIEKTVNNESKIIEELDSSENKLLVTLRNNLIGKLDNTIRDLKNAGTFISNANGNFNIDTKNNINNYLSIFITEMKQVGKTIKILRYLILLSSDKAVVICGSNGVGKSSFASYLKSTYMNNVFAIPAEKYLFYNDIKDRLLSNNVNFTKLNVANTTLLVRQQDIIGRHTYSSFSKSILDRFTVSMIYLVNKHVEELNDSYKTSKSINFTFDRVSTLFSSIFSNLSLETDTTNRIINVYNKINKEKYSIDNMSEGEKVALFYLVNIILLPKNSYILIDEPETFMNPLIYVKLWDLLQKERNDCKFIFISHSVEFIESRTNTEILWIKSFVYPDFWEFKSLNDNDTESIPKELLMSLVGAKKPLLLCEGTKNSFDYKVYSQLFINYYSVVPVEGHDSVIRGVKSINNLINNLNISSKAIGIIDGDGLLDSETINNIYKLPFNEIEMLLISNEVMESVMKINYSDYKEKIADFKNLFNKKFKSGKNQILINTITNRINNKLLNSFVKKPKKLKELKSNYNKTDNEIKSLLDYKNLDKKLNQIIENDNYEEMLRYCNLKGEIVPGLVNRMESNYEEKALNRIIMDSNLREILRNKIMK